MVGGEQAPPLVRFGQSTIPGLDDVSPVDSLATKEFDRAAVDYITATLKIGPPNSAVAQRR